MIDACQWDGNLQKFETWFGERVPCDFGERISIPTNAKKNTFLRVWVGSWVLRDQGENHVITDAVYRLLTPQSIEVCCGNYGTCQRACTPRGEQKAYERVAAALDSPTNEQMFEIERAFNEHVVLKAPSLDMATCLIRYNAAWDRIVAPIRAALDGWNKETAVKCSHRWWIGKDRVSTCRRCGLKWDDYEKSKLLTQSENPKGVIQPPDKPTKLLAAYTPTAYEGPTPPYFNITQVGGMVRVSMRGDLGDTSAAVVNLWNLGKIGDAFAEACRTFDNAMPSWKGRQ